VLSESCAAEVVDLEVVVSSVVLGERVVVVAVVVRAEIVVACDRTIVVSATTVEICGGEVMVVISTVVDWCCWSVDVDDLSVFSSSTAVV
jgi:hypothetical protein